MSDKPWKRTESPSRHSCPRQLSPILGELIFPAWGMCVCSYLCFPQPLPTCPNQPSHSASFLSLFSSIIPTPNQPCLLQPAPTQHNPATALPTSPQASQWPHPSSPLCESAACEVRDLTHTPPSALALFLGVFCKMHTFHLTLREGREASSRTPADMADEAPFSACPQSTLTPHTAYSTL